MSGKTRLIDVISDAATCMHRITYFTRGGDAVDYFDYKKYAQAMPAKFVEVNEEIARGEFKGKIIVRICPYCVEAIGKIEASVIEHGPRILEFLRIREEEDRQAEAALAEQFTYRRMYGDKS